MIFQVLLKVNSKLAEKIKKQFDYPERKQMIFELMGREFVQVYFPQEKYNPTMIVSVKWLRVAFLSNHFHFGDWVLLNVYRHETLNKLRQNWERLLSHEIYEGWFSVIFHLYVVVEGRLSNVIDDDKSHYYLGTSSSKSRRKKEVTSWCAELAPERTGQSHNRSWLWEAIARTRTVSSDHQLIIYH